MDTYTYDGLSTTISFGTLRFSICLATSLEAATFVSCTPAELFSLANDIFKRNGGTLFKSFIAFSAARYVP